MATKKTAPKQAGKSAAPEKKANTAQTSVARTAPAKAGKAAAKPVVKQAAPAKKQAAKEPVKGKAAASKTAAKHIDAQKEAPKAKTAPVKRADPIKKPVVAAKSQQEVKPEIKPLEKPVAKKEAPKAVKTVAIPKTSTTKSVKYEPEFMKSVLDKKKQQQESGPTQRYSDGELIEFRDLINRKLDSAKKELTYLQGLITRKDDSGDLDEGRYMTMEDGSMSMEREQLSQMASRQIQFIDHLEKAIMRIENKTYGICRVSGKLIDKARLRAVPHATLSMEAKQTMNR